jgi:O-antigen/teichoic acid export membrane protein
MTSLNLSLLKEGAWVIAGQVISGVGIFAGIRLLTEFTRPEVYGELALSLGIVALAQGLSSGPLMQAALRYSPESLLGGWQEFFRAVVTKAISKTVLVASVMLLMSWGLFSWTTSADWTLGPGLVLLLIVETRKSMDLTFLNAARRHREVATWYIMDAWLRPLLAVAGIAWFGASTLIVLNAYSLGTGLLIFGFKTFATQESSREKANLSSLPPRIRDEMSETKLWAYAAPLIPLALVSWVSGQLDRYIIGSTLGLAEVGIYAAIYGAVSRPILMAATAIELTMRPVYYQARAAKDERAKEEIRRIWLFLLIVTGVCATAMVCAFHEWLAGLLVAEPYRHISYLMPAVALGYSILAIAQFHERLCYAHDRTSAVLMINTVGAVASIAMVIPAIQVLGLDGAAYVVPVCFSVQLTVAVLLANRIASPNVRNREAV